MRAILLIGFVLASFDARAQVPVVDVPLTVTNRESVALPLEPVTSGVPFAEGVLPDIAQLRLLKDGSEIPAQFLVTARWPNGSARWVLVDFQVDLPPSGASPVTLRTGQAPAPVSGIAVRDEPGTLTVDTRRSTFVFDKAELALRGHRFQVQAGDATYRAVPRSWVIEEQGPMKVVVRVDGDWRNGSATLVNDANRFRARMVFHRERGDVRLFLTFQNNNSFGWNTSGEGEPRVADLTLQGAGFGPLTLLPGGAYRFGSGVEKTWEVSTPESGDPLLRTTRYDAAGRLLAGDVAPRPLAVAPPGYYASTRGWGTIGLPVTGLPPERQEDFDRFERFHLSKVDPAAVENPPGLTGMTLWGHLSADAGSWNDYGDLRWDGNGCGTLSGNHYDWTFGMYLQFMRSGRLAYADAARVLARHEIDFDIYHTGRDGGAYNFQKHWEDRPSHDNPANCFGPGRPSHTWSQGYALQWLLTGDRRGKDAFDEIQEGVRQFVYESFNGDGRVDTSEIRIHGWIVENLVNRWRIEPTAVLNTSQFGPKSIQAAIQDVLRNVFDRESVAGGEGFVISDDDEGGHLRQPIMHAYFVEPAIKAYAEVFAGRDAEYADRLLGLVRRMTRWLMRSTYGGDSNTAGGYRPRQIPYWVDTRQSEPAEGQLPYLLMAGNAAGFLYTQTRDEEFRAYARAAFQDYVRYVGAIGPDTYGDASARTPAAYNSSIFVGTESKIQGWCTRYGQYLLASESPAPGLSDAGQGIRR